MIKNIAREWVRFGEKTMKNTAEKLKKTLEKRLECYEKTFKRYQELEERLDSLKNDHDNLVTQYLLRFGPFTIEEEYSHADLKNTLTRIKSVNEKFKLKETLAKILRTLPANADPLLTVGALLSFIEPIARKLARAGLQDQLEEYHTEITSKKLQSDTMKFFDELVKNCTNKKAKLIFFYPQSLNNLTATMGDIYILGRALAKLAIRCQIDQTLNP